MVSGTNGATALKINGAVSILSLYRGGGGWGLPQRVTIDKAPGMPSEYRFLVFSPSEAATALAAFARKTGKPLPTGRLTGAEPTGAKVIGGQLMIDTASGPAEAVTFGADEVLEALIGFCLDRRIPLPMASEKTLEKLHGRFALRIGHIDSIEYQMRSHAPRAE